MSLATLSLAFSLHLLFPLSEQSSEFSSLQFTLFSSFDLVLLSSLFNLTSLSCALLFFLHHSKSSSNSHPSFLFFCLCPSRVMDLQLQCLVLFAMAPRHGAPWWRVISLVLSFCFHGGSSPTMCSSPSSTSSSQPSMFGHSPRPPHFPPHHFSRTSMHHHALRHFHLFPPTCTVTVLTFKQIAAQASLELSRQLPHLRHPTVFCASHGSVLDLLSLLAALDSTFTVVALWKNLRQGAVHRVQDFCSLLKVPVLVPRAPYHN